MEKPKFPSKSGVRRIVYSRWFWVTMAALAFIGLILTLLPYGFDYGAERWLMSHGADLATVDDIDFNPFTGTLVVHDLQVEVGNARVMHIKEAILNVDWLPFWRRKAHVEKLTGALSVLRGGSWFSSARIVRSAYRRWDTPDFRSHVIGFRVARDF